MKAKSPCYPRCILREKSVWVQMEVGDPCPIELYIDRELRRDWLRNPRLASDAEYCQLVDALIEASICGDRAAMAVAADGGRMFQLVEREIDGERRMAEELTPQYRQKSRLMGRHLNILRKLNKRRHEIMSTLDW